MAYGNGSVTEESRALHLPLRVTDELNPSFVALRGRSAGIFDSMCEAGFSPDIEDVSDADMLAVERAATNLNSTWITITRVSAKAALVSLKKQARKRFHGNLANVAHTLREDLLLDLVEEGGSAALDELAALGDEEAWKLGERAWNGPSRPPIMGECAAFLREKTISERLSKAPTRDDEAIASLPLQPASFRATAERRPRRVGGVVEKDLVLADFFRALVDSVRDGLPRTVDFALTSVEGGGDPLPIRAVLAPKHAASLLPSGYRGDAAAWFAAGLRGIAVEAGGALVLGRGAVTAEADRLGLFIRGVEIVP